MRIQKIFYKVNTYCFKKIVCENEVLKDESIINLKNSFYAFKKLLAQNRLLKKGVGNKLPIKEIEKITNLSKSKYYRINAEVKIKGLTYWKTLEFDKQNNIKKRKPKNFRQSKIGQEIKDFILKIRLENPTYSERKIKIILLRDYEITLGHSTIGKILKELNKKSLINIKGSKLKKDKTAEELEESKPKPRNFTNRYSQPFNYEKQHISNKKYFINKTTGEKMLNKINNIDKITKGELIQIDHLKINKNQKRFIQFNAIDPITRIKSSYCYSSATSKNAKHFLTNILIKQLPFPIKSIQVDGGSEFRMDFEEACKELNIPLFVLPPHTPKNNGRVERVNQTDRKEFWNNKKLTESCNEIYEFNEKLAEYTNKYNNYRPHQNLDFLSPMAYNKLLENMR